MAGDVGRWRSGSPVQYPGELWLMWQTAPYWQQAGRVRANTRVQAGTSEAASALNWRRRTSTSATGGAPAAVRGRGGGSAHREKMFGRDAETCGMYRNDSKGTGEWCTLAHAHRRQGVLLCL